MTLVGLERIDDNRPKFSPDGRWNAFGSLDGRGRSSVYLARSDGTGLRRLVAGTSPAWRP